MRVADIIEITLLSVLVVLAAYAVWMHHSNKLTRADIFERGREVGYRKGYADRQAEEPRRPVVVPLHCQSCGEPARRAG